MTSAAIAAQVAREAVGHRSYQQNYWHSKNLTGRNVGFSKSGGG